ncbi:MAG: ABC transporter ATP-binding protein [Planctomycetota bacterium]|nr:MAG: ABC transporter ATP-binding protein [Planctomycetota bacterium]
MSEPLLEIDDLQVQFDTEDGLVRAVDGVSFDVAPGETLGIVGESGSGKSVTSLAIMGLVPQPPGRIAGGQVRFAGRDLIGLPQADMAAIRGNHIAMIFQDPMTALNPFLTVADQLCEVTQRHRGYTRRQALDHAVDLLEQVGIPNAARRILDYPHQFSGGMRQRVMIAMALSCQPQVLIADEPTTALDVTIQAQILALMKALQAAVGTAIVLITHDMGVIANSCDRVCVMYAGRIVEEAPVDELFASPRHPYTLGLLESIPRLDEAQAHRLTPIEGQPPDLMHLPKGCAFAPRCPFSIERCHAEDPPLEEHEARRHACFVDVATAARHPVAEQGGHGPGSSSPQGSSSPEDAS